ncbi:MAG: HAMP domain-containing histidine kinase [Gammaproteobacteria bacterium]|nr:HAMP domain-containing histidine kinase [Gammaproteobacteria bacterium]
MPLPVDPSSNAANLRRLNGQRLIVLAAQCGVVLLAISRWDYELPLLPLLALFVTVLGISFGTLWRLARAPVIADAELFLQLTIDVAALTVLLYLTGGAGNPFTPFFLLPLTLTAVALPGGYAWAMVILTLTCYTLLTRFYLPLPPVHPGFPGGMHEIGMWFSFAFSAFLIALYAVRMGHSVRERDRMIATLHEQKLQQDHLLALGTLAAGAAHELGTPLATLAVVLKDVDPAEPLGGERLGLLQDQVMRCKGILGSLTATAGGWRAESGRAIDLESWLRQMIDDWRASRPGLDIDLSLDGPRPAPRLVVEQTLTQALTNVCNNAADVSPAAVAIAARWTPDLLVFEVRDRGTGVAPELRAKVGAERVTTKQDGLGLGLFLTFQTLRRFGGTVNLSDRTGGGTCCRIELPLAGLRLADDP